ERYRDAHYDRGLQIIDDMRMFAADNQIELTKLGIVRAQKTNERARVFDTFLREDEIRMALLAALRRDDNAQAARVYAHQMRIPTATPKGVPRSSKDQIILDMINQNLPEGTPMFNSIGEVPPEISKRALAKHQLEVAPKKLAQQELSEQAQKLLSEVQRESDPLLDWLDSMDSTYQHLDTEFSHKLNNLSAMSVRDMPDDLQAMVLQRIEIMRSQYMQVDVWKNKPLVAKGEAIVQGETPWTGAGSTYDLVAPWWRNMEGSKDPKGLIRGFDNIINMQKDQTAIPSRLKLNAMFEMLDLQDGNPFFMLWAGDERGAVELAKKYIDSGMPYEEMMSAFAAGDDLGSRLFDLLDTPLDELSPLSEVIDLRSLIGKTPPQVVTSTEPFSRQAVTAENLGGVEDLLNELLGAIKTHWSDVKPAKIDRTIEGSVNAYAKQAARMVDEARLVSRDVANETRKFALHAYTDKTYLDLALSYVFPYHFWYGRTYVNWMKRLVYNPEVIAAYANTRMRWLRYMLVRLSGGNTTSTPLNWDWGNRFPSWELTRITRCTSTWKLP
ncbi:MAG: hypothetical protein ACWGQW_05650, partial [bacterium]